MAKENFLRGAFILTVAGMMVKVLGAVSRIFISRFLGGEGVGIYQMAYPIYLLIMAVSSAGIPVAISILVSERLALFDYKGAKKTFSISLSFMVFTGLFFSVLMYFGASWLVESGMIRDQRAYWALVSLTPAIFFVTVLASFRGYFQGFQRMTPTAVSQITEQLVRVITMIALAYFLLPYGLEYAAAGAAFGAVPGAFFGLLTLLAFYYKYKNHDDRQYEELHTEHEPLKTADIARRLVQLAVPVSLANIMIPVVSSIDALIVPVRLEAAGFSISEATTLFGYLTGMALPLVMMATIPTTSLALSLVPSVSEAYTLGDRDGLKSRMNTAMRLASIITVPCFLGLAVLATPVSKLLYGTYEAGSVIAIMASGIFFLGLHQVTTAMLQGIKRAVVPMVNMGLSAVVKTVMVWIVTAVPSWNIDGAAWASVIDFALAAVLNIFFLYRFTGLMINIADLLRVFGAGLSMAVCAHLTYLFMAANLSSASVATVLAIMAGAFVYAVMLLVFGCIGKNELQKIPVIGTKLTAFLIKVRLVRE